MGRSFYYGTETQLYNQSQVFSATISSDPARFGLVEAQCVHYAALTLAYADAYFAMTSAATRTRGARWAKLNARRILCDATAALAKIITATATVTPPDRIALGLSVTPPPQPPRTPGTPRSFSIELSPIGLLLLKWKCANPQRGVMYIVSRSVANGAFEYLGLTGERRYTDATIPAGATAIRYQVQAMRLKQAGHPATFDVNFGSNGQKLPASMQMKHAA